ncbi:MAG: glycine cleavage system protein GcvH [Chloroflexi bacterium]|nr:glycine cleavage system protein GcvH [Chloroflexota bacterium]
MSTVRGCNLPEDLHYLVEKHVWVRPESDGAVTVGITDVAQHLARKLVSATVKKTTKPIEKGKSVATLESGKWVGPVAAPVTGEIVASNDAVMKTPSLINDDPYGAGWIVRMKPTNWDADKAALVTGADGVAAYQAFMEKEGIKCE